MIEKRLLLGISLALTLLTVRAGAQESRIAAEFRREAEHLAESCAAFPKAASCAIAVATGHPLHLAFGSIAPQNGLALGAAFGTSHAPSETWRLNWSGDAVRSFRGAWRAGAYMKLVHVPEQTITVVTGPAASPAPGALATRPSTVINLYGQTTSLDRVSFFGFGPSSSRDDHTAFGMQQGIVGASVIAPIAARGLARWNLSLLGEAHGRFVTIDNQSAESLAIGDRFAEDQTLGLTFEPPAYLQLGEGIRMKPSLFGGHLALNYTAGVQQFVARGSQPLSFQRWRVDLGHEIPLYGRSISVAAGDANDPNDCGSASGGGCPSISHDRRGAITIRALYVTSTTAEGHAVPFFFQPTLGGSDVNGRASLASFDDYRFRGPHLLLFQQSIEHSVWGPIGAWVQLDQGMVALDRRDFGARALKRTFSVGATVRAGGFPMVVLSYATGGGEGHHVAAVINTSLLGGSPRPPLD